ncbi:hypothetical protein DFR30_0079 [Thiogranum longum]|uniref:Uncharacterized protein n=1 Tax=Thiogranum longum TaxID=1537524 RepID=A0A4R1H9R3_9GAMM|nr:hypothetical protein [Thiogranum longum]TCK16860.1 hypothetical protein DFR30_0079 [Thiogranum longum]
MKYVIYVNGEQSSLYQVGRHSVQHLGSYLAGLAGMHRLRDALLKLHHHPVSILVDLIEEEFRHDNLPHILGRDRARMLARMAGKLFRGTPFRYSQVIGRSREGRRDDKALFSALTNPDNLMPLISLLDETATPLEGIFSLPLISADILKPMRACGENILLITEQPGGGLRETFLRKGTVEFSRLAPIQESSPEEYCRLLDAEVHKTHRYLNTLRLVAPGESIDVYPVADSLRCEAVARECRESEQLAFYPVDIRQLALATGCKNFPDTGFSDALFAFLLGNSRHGNHYAQPQHLKRMRGWQGSVAIRAASWILAVIGLSWSGMNVIDGWMATREQVQIAASRESISERYTQLTQELPVQPAEARAMREATALANSLEQHPLQSSRIFGLLGKAFTINPELELRKLRWFTSDKTDAREPVSLVSSNNTAGLPLPVYSVAIVSGSLREFDGSYQHAQDQIEKMVAWLSDQPGVITVDIERAPIDTRPDTQIQGEIDNRLKNSRADFELRVVMELDNETV